MVRLLGLQHIQSAIVVVEVTVVGCLISTILSKFDKIENHKIQNQKGTRIFRLTVITPIRVGMIISSSVGHKLDRVFNVQRG